MEKRPVIEQQSLDLREKGAVKDGVPQTLDRRLFVQLLAFGGCKDVRPLVKALERSGLEAVLYEDANDPRGVALVTFSEDPEFFISRVRGFLAEEPFSSLNQKLEYSMLGRTYSLGHEPDLEDWLLKKPRRTSLNKDWPWAIWYPLRRAGAFNALPPDEQGPILREHGKIGHAFGESELARDVRLACFGIDKNDNDFVIGLIGKELHPLSACVQAMRKTKQTSTYIQSMGPFFVGRAVWQSDWK